MPCIRVARRQKYILLTDDGLKSAGDEGVSLVFLGAVAVGHVVDHVALGVGSAHANARVTALVTEAGLVSRTLRAQHTLGLALDVRVAVEVLAAGAFTVVAVGVGTARAR